MPIISGMLSRQWTIYLAQDKHLDYNWCGTPAEIEARMVALVDYYLDQVETTGSRWNLDGTLWLDVYRRHRGDGAAHRLYQAIRDGGIGYGANHSVLLWGLLSTELAIRACYGALPIEQATGRPSGTVLIMENFGLPWGVASTLSESGFSYLGRGVYPLRAESYHKNREAIPLFWWLAPNGRRMLVHWDLYQETGSWGGYAEAFELARIAGETWDAYHVRDFGDRNTDEVYQRRVAFVHDTVARYEAYGNAYPVSSILLLGTGWDNWTRTDDYAAFIRRFNAESDGAVRLVDARYEEYFDAVSAEIRDRDLEIPTLSGTFGICWEEWAAHLAGPTADFREAERLMRQVEATHALALCRGSGDTREAAAIQEGYAALLRFAEHDFGGTDRARAAISAGVRAGAATEALSVARALSPEPDGRPWPILGDATDEAFDFDWRGGRVRFEADGCGVASLVDAEEREWVAQGAGLALGEFVHTRYGDPSTTAVFPEVLPRQAETHLQRMQVYRGANGVAVETVGERWGFQVATQWFFHGDRPWIDVTYDLERGWTEAPQSVQFCFPLAIPCPTYRYDTAGALVVAGPIAEGGHDLPGANPSLYAAQTYAAAHSEDRGAFLLIPDAPLVQFGPEAVQDVCEGASAQAQIVSMPMMNLTRNDWQFNQGGQRQWRFRYRLVLSGPYDVLQAIREAQAFCVPPYLQVPGRHPELEALRELDIEFTGGPVLTLKTAEDGRRLILRLWNVLAQPVPGTVGLPEGFSGAEVCDALERAQHDLPIDAGRGVFTAGPHSIVTLALLLAQ
ncbi:MAG: glycosyl hydrolase-related protein [Anaerolineae bacterium]